MSLKTYPVAVCSENGVGLLNTGEALPKDSLELIGLTLEGFRPFIVLVTNQVVVRDLEV